MSTDLSSILRESVALPMPRVCADIEGMGGTLKTVAQDFEVEEVPAYLPSGTGDHLYLWLEKTNMPAMQLTSWLAKSLRIKPQDIGCAGLKDARAITRQYVSVPAATEAQLAALDGHPNVRLLSVKAHGNKLKTGHLKGNRFSIRVRGVTPDACERAQVMLQRLQHTGLPNAYGPQRFGYQGHTAVLGAELLGLLPENPQGSRRLGRNTLRLALSALQSAVFNACLRARITQGLYQTPLLGDVMQVRASGGPFVVDDVAREQQRLRASEIVLTGPMPGPKMRAATGAGLAQETAVLEALQLQWSHFAGPNKLMQGTRRPLTVWLEEGQVHKETTEAGEHNLLVQFTLPKGAFATCVMSELMGYDIDVGDAAAPAMSA